MVQVQESDKRREWLCEVRQQWKRVLELMTAADSLSHGMRKRAEETWLSFMEYQLGEVLRDAPAWMNATPACSYLDMVTSLSVLLAKAERAASRATDAHAREQQRGERRQQRQQALEARAQDKLLVAVDNGATEDTEEAMKTRDEHTAEFLCRFESHASDD